MASLQYVIDSICSSVTAECIEKIIEEYLSRGPYCLDEILPLIQSKDHSLDITSARMIAEAARDELARRGTVRIEGVLICPAN